MSDIKLEIELDTSQLEQVKSFFKIFGCKSFLIRPVEQDSKYSFSIPKDLYKEFIELCKLTNWDVQERILVLFKSTVESAEIVEYNQGKYIEVYNF